MPRADFLQRSELLLGTEAVAKLEKSSVCICGLGGVGSFAAEAAARSGFGRIRLIDFDDVALSNINRQLPALHSTVGKSKAEVMAARIADIAPDAICETEKCLLSAENIAEKIGEPDFVIDAIDDVQAKIALAEFCLSRGIGIVSVMGTGNRLCPELLAIADISRTHNCPLAKAVRVGLRKKGFEKGLTVVFSPEEPVQVQPDEAGERSIGSCAFVPSAAGLLALSVAVRSLLALPIKKA